MLDIDPWPRAERDFNPPETRAARHALFPDPIPDTASAGISLSLPDTASAGISLSLISAPTAQGSRSMFVFSVARPFVCGCHIISTLPSARTIPGLPGSLASLLHRVARTHLGAMGWNQCAFAPIVRARPFPIFGRPVHPRDGSRRLRPGGSPHALQTPPRGGRPALQSFRSWLQLCLGRIRLSPSCPFRHLHYLSTLRPVRHYPHLLDIDPWPRAERDFNPPACCQARTISQSDFRQAFGSSSRCWLVQPYKLRLNLTDLPCSHEILGCMPAVRTPEAPQGTCHCVPCDSAFPLERQGRLLQPRSISGLSFRSLVFRPTPSLSTLRSVRHRPPRKTRYVAAG